MAKNKEKILVTKSSIPSIDDFVKEIEPIFKSRWLTNMGAKHQELEKKLKSYLKVKNLSLMVNGHMAIEMVLRAFYDKYDWKSEDEVITTPFTFISTTHAIVRSSLRPIFADIDERTCCITPETIEPLINKKTVAIMPVHVYGNICDVVGIEKLAKKYDLKVIYDAAHAFGEEVNDRGIGSYGDASIFSFHATKVFNTIEGGAACFGDSTLEKRLYNLKNFGIKYDEPDIIEAVGANAKMNEFAAAMGLCNLRLVRENILARKKIIDRYVKNLAPNKNIKILTEIAKKSYKDKNYNVKNNYAYMPCQFKSKKARDDVMKSLENNNIFPRKYFYPLTSDARCYRTRKDLMINETPTAKRIANSVLTLPVYPDLELAKVDEICSVIEAATNK